MKSRVLILIIVFLIGLQSSGSIYQGGELVSSTSPPNQECIPKSEVVSEISFALQIGRGVYGEGHPQYVNISNEDCEIMDLNFIGNDIIFAKKNVDDFLQIRELLTKLRIDYTNSTFFGEEIDSLNPYDCMERNQCKHPRLSIKSHYGETVIPLWFALENNIMISDGDWLGIEIVPFSPYDNHGLIATVGKTESNHYTSLTEGCSSRHDDSEFLPYQVNNLSRVTWNCDLFSSISINIQNVSATDRYNYTKRESTQAGSQIINPESENKLLFAITGGIGNGADTVCKVSLYEFGKPNSIDYWDIAAPYQNCEGPRVDVLGMSHNNEHMLVALYISGSSGGVHVVNLSDKSSIKITSSSWSQYDPEINFEWAPFSNNLIYEHDETGDLYRLNADTGDEEFLFSKDVLDAYSSGVNSQRWFDMSNIFGDETLFVSLLDEDYTYLKIEFSTDFSSYEISETWTEVSSTGGSCSSSPPVMNLEHQLIDMITFSLPQFTSSCHPKIFFEDYKGYVSVEDPIRIYDDIRGKWCFDPESSSNDDYDGDAKPNDCDLDIDDDAVPNWIDYCLSDASADVNAIGCDIDLSLTGDQDFDGIVNRYDICFDGVQNWTRDSYLQDFSYDNDNDGCHDILEDDDDDNDNVIDSIDDCPLRENGRIDIDMDGLCEGDDLDDDGDNYSDVDENRCGSDSTNSSDMPDDYDLDMVCDDLDDDIDGDGFANEDDVFPFDEKEWNDLDSDGFGNNSDDCVGTYGTSTVDRLGCLDQDGDGVSDLNDLDPYDAEIGLDEYDGPRLDIDEENETNLSTDQTDMASESDGVVVYSVIGVFIVAGIIIFVRSRRSSLDEDEEEYGEADEFYRNVTTTPVTSSDEPSSQNIPDFSLSGSQHESGYEVLEYPEGSEQWWWKDTENQCWVIWE